MEDELQIRIFVLDRGFVGVCRSKDPKGSGFWIEVKDWRTIRTWGTTKGLAELVKGPTSSTQMDAIATTVDIPTRAIIKVFLAEESGWNHHLNSNGSGKKLEQGSRRRTTTES